MADREKRYIYGSAAPEIRREPRKKEEEISEREYLRRARLQVENKVRAKKAECRQFSFLQTVVLLSAAITLVSVLGMFVLLNAGNFKAKARVNSLEKQVQELREANFLLENEEMSRIDYDAVYSYATENLGMSIPDKQQVVYYARQTGEYVERTAEIPNE